MDARGLLLVSAGAAAGAATAGVGTVLLCTARRGPGGELSAELAAAARVAAATRLLLAPLLLLWLWQLHSDVGTYDPRAALWLPDERRACFSPLRASLALLAAPQLTNLHHHPAFRALVRRRKRGEAETISRQHGM